LAQYGGGYLLCLSASTFTFFNLGGGATSVAVDYLVVAGGAGGGFSTGGTNAAGGGGAGGLLTGTAVSVPKGYSMTVTVGAKGNGASAGTADGALGSNSLFYLATAYGGGGGQTGDNINTIARGVTRSGASGGGSCGASTAIAGLGLTIISQGNNGGTSGGSNGGSGGGGHSAVGANAPSNTGGAGGAGTSSSISGSATVYAAGGGGGGYTTGVGGAGGSSGVGGAGGNPSAVGGNATANRGSGGGGAGLGGLTGGNGSDGIVIIRTADTVATAVTTGAPTVTTAGGYTVYSFTASGTITF
jgi:hypothetical protein